MTNPESTIKEMQPYDASITARRLAIQPDPLTRVERYVPLAVRLCVYAFLTVVFFQAEELYYGHDPGMQPPLLISSIHNLIFLPLHEGGHFLFMFFGKTLHILGGSFWQVMFPLIWFIIALRRRSQMAPFALFWAGENLMDVSVYIRDAPYRALPLLGHKSGHDWYNLLTEWSAMDMAQPIADWSYYGGFLICTGAIIGGIVWAIVVAVRGIQT